VATISRARCQGFKAELIPLWDSKVGEKVCRLYEKRVRHAERVGIAGFTNLIIIGSEDHGVGGPLIVESHDRYGG
jgi:hypothetical protein